MLDQGRRDQAEGKSSLLLPTSSANFSFSSIVNASSCALRDSIGSLGSYGSIVAVEVPASYSA